MGVGKGQGRGGEYGKGGTASWSLGKECGRQVDSVLGELDVLRDQPSRLAAPENFLYLV